MQRSSYTKERLRVRHGFVASGVSQRVESYRPRRPANGESIVRPVASQRDDGPQDLSFHPTKTLLAVGSITGDIRLLSCRPLLDADTDSPADIDRQFEGELAEKATLRPAVYYTSVIAFLRQLDSVGGA